MKKLLLLVPFLCFFVFADFTENKGDYDKPDQKMATIKEKLELIESKYISVLGYKERREAIKTMDEVMGLLDDLDREETRQRVGQPMPGEEFSQFIRRLNKVMDAYGKKLEVYRISITNYYTVDQLMQILNSFKFDDDKIEVVIALYPKLTDKRGAHRLEDAFTFDSSKKKLNQVLDSFDKQDSRERGRERGR